MNGLIEELGELRLHGMAQAAKELYQRHLFLTRDEDSQIT